MVACRLVDLDIQVHTLSIANWNDNFLLKHNLYYSWYTAPGIPIAAVPIALVCSVCLVCAGAIAIALVWLYLSMNVVHAGTLG